MRVMAMPIETTAVGKVRHLIWTLVKNAKIRWETAPQNFFMEKIKHADADVNVDVVVVVVVAVVVVVVVVLEVVVVVVAAEQQQQY